ncbi:hypothetical protein, partial [Escherichia coli]
IGSINLKSCKDVVMLFYFMSTDGITSVSYYDTKSGIVAVLIFHNTGMLHYWWNSPVSGSVGDVAFLCCE